MPDLDRQLGELRTSLQDIVHQPELNRLIERSRQRTTRRRTQVVAVLAVLLVAAMIPVLRTVLRPVTVPPITSPTTAPPFPADPFQSAVDFADERHGYAVRSNCPGGHGPCDHTLLVTEDGQHWATRALPPEFATTFAFPGLTVLGPRSVTVGGELSAGLPRFHSSDAGQTWEEVSKRDLPEIAAIPDGGILEQNCPTIASCQLVGTDPASGRLGRLATTTPVRDMHPAVRHPVAGAWWLVGPDPATGRQVVASSRDGGRGWTRSDLPAPVTASEFFVSSDGQTLYLTAYGTLSDPGARPGLIAIFRSNDDGASWQQTWRAKDGARPRAIIGVPAAANGRLIVSDSESGPAWISDDGGKSFRQAPELGISGAIWLTGAGYLSGPLTGKSNVYKVSTDGLRWKEITVG